MNYYNEYDIKAAEWLRELINRKLIPDGIVDTRSICDVKPDDLRDYTQCHFFAGVGGWSYALQLAGVDPDERLWTGSCPCQSFSTAGKQKGFDDHRDLWPVFFNLIRECKPAKVFGEQVANAIKFGWLDRVYADLESAGYACGAAVIGAHSVGAPHQRQRLYWGAERVSDTANNGYDASNQGTGRTVGGCEQGRMLQSAGSGNAMWLSDTARGQCEQSVRTQGNEFQRSADDLSDCRMAEISESIGRRGRSNGDSRGQGRKVQAPGLCACGGMANDNNERREEQCLGISMEATEQRQAERTGAELRSNSIDLGESESVRLQKSGSQPACPFEASSRNDNLSSLPWSRYALVYCRDNKVRRVPAKSVLFGVADGVSGGMDIGRADRGFPLCKTTSFEKGQIAVLLKGYGNAINTYTAALFLIAFNGDN